VVVFTAGNLIFDRILYGRLNAFNIIAVCVACVWLAIPIRPIVKCISPTDIEENLQDYEANEFKFATDYDRENPVTRDEAIEAYFNKLMGKMDNEDDKKQMQQALDANKAPAGQEKKKFSNMSAYAGNLMNGGLNKIGMNPFARGYPAPQQPGGQPGQPGQLGIQGPSGFGTSFGRPMGFAGYPQFGMPRMPGMTMPGMGRMPSFGYPGRMNQVVPTFNKPGPQPQQQGLIQMQPPTQQIIHQQPPQQTIITQPQPNQFQAQPNQFQGQPNQFQGQPNMFQQQPNQFQGQPNQFQGQPNQFQGQPNMFQPQPQFGQPMQVQPQGVQFQMNGMQGNMQMPNQFGVNPQNVHVNVNMGQFGMR